MKRAYGPHTFTRDEGAVIFHQYMKDKFPDRFREVFDAPLVDKKGRMNWAPPGKKEMRWSDMVDKLTGYYFMADPALMKLTAKQFPGAFWERFKEEILPKTGKHIPAMLSRFYHYAALAPDDVFVL